MTASRRTGNGFAVASEIRSLARPLTGPADLAPLVDRVGASRFVGIGEASHGTHERSLVVQPARAPGNRRRLPTHQRARELRRYQDGRSVRRPDLARATAALRPLHHELRPAEPELETEPTGF